MDCRGYEIASVMLGENKDSLDFLPVFRQSASSMVWELPPQLGEGLFTSECLPSGLTLTFSRLALSRSFYARLMASTEDITLVFGLCGCSVNKNPSMQKGFTLGPGENCLYWFSDKELIREAAKTSRLDALVITIPKKRLLPSPLGADTGPCCQQGLADLFEKEFYLQKHPNSRRIGKVLGEILHCPFTGQTRQFFMEAKALELIALKLEIIQGSPARPAGVSKDEMEGVLAARDFLLQNIRKPPTIGILAKKAGMSHPRLGRSFKLVFGCSPFELLRQRRLQWAVELIGEDEMNLTEIAYAVGYASSSHFSKAFSEHFKLTPSQYRRKRLASPYYSLVSFP